MDTKQSNRPAIVLGSIAAAVIVGAVLVVVALLAFAPGSSSQSSSVEQATQHCVDAGVAYAQQNGNIVDKSSITQTCLQLLQRDGDKKFVSKFGN